MINIQEKISLKAYNTFGIDVKAKHFVTMSSTEEIIEFCSKHLKDYQKHLILGGGSNILFTKDFDGIVVKIENKSIEIIEEDEKHVFVKAAAGEIWDELAKYCVMRNYGGIENLSNIPGTVGAAPVQNIGAYGVEFKDAFVQLEAIEIITGKTQTFSKNECEFGYRKSIFKDRLKGRYVITSVVLRLTKHPVLSTEYGSIKEELSKMNITDPGIHDIRQAVINIRSAKLPDPDIIGNAGSFFKNPVVENKKLESLKQRYPGIPSYKQDENNVKLAAGWLIDQCGWKGKSIGNAGVHKDQALVIVNHGDASGKEILSLADNIRDSVFEKFRIQLTPEVNIV